MQSLACVTLCCTMHGPLTDDDAVARLRHALLFTDDDAVARLRHALQSDTATEPFEIVLYTSNGQFHFLIFYLLNARCKYSTVQQAKTRATRNAHRRLADDCSLVSDSTRRSLRSADVPTCMVPRTLSSFGDKTFTAAGPRLWNSSGPELRNPDITYGLFRRELYGHPFRELPYEHGAVSSDMWRLRKTLTYLLTYLQAML